MLPETEESATNPPGSALLGLGTKPKKANNLGRLPLTGRAGMDKNI
jgi:hypothetical protein